MEYLNKILDNPIYTLLAVGGVTFLVGNYMAGSYAASLDPKGTVLATLKEEEVKKYSERGIMAEKAAVAGVALMAGAGFLAAANMIRGREALGPAGGL